MLESVLRAACAGLVITAGCSQPLPAPAPSGSAAGGSSSAPLPDPAPSASASAAPAPSGLTLFVDSKMVDCEGVGPMRCLRIRKAPTEEWELLYDSIVGFVHEEPNLYELRVEKRPVPGGRTDAPSFRYHLLEVVSKRRAP
jgi:hypothetical protein